MNRRLIAVGATAVALLLGLVVFMWVGESKEGRELRELKARLVAAGEELTYAELAGGKIYNNTRVIQALTNELNRLSGLDPGLVRLSAGPERVIEMDPPPGTGTAQTGSWAQIELILKEADPALSNIKALLDQEPEPWVTRTSTFRPGAMPYHLYIEASRWLGLAAVAEARAGNRTSAVQSIRCLANLANSNKEDRTLFSSIVCAPAIRFCVSATWQILQKEGWTSEELAQLSRVLEGVKPLDNLEAGWIGDRAACEETWKLIEEEGLKAWGAKAGLPHINKLPFFLVHNRDADHLLHLTYVQEYLERCRSVKDRQGVVRSSGGTNIWASALFKTTGGQLRFPVSANSVPRGEEAENVAIDNEAQRQVTLAALALMRWKLEHGKPARSLEEAAAAYGLDLYDPYTGKGLLCRESAYGLVPYCVGEDLKDDGGHPASDKPWRTKDEPK